MSYEATSWALEQPVGGTKKIVLIGIASHSDRHGRNAWPSVETLALYAYVDPRSVQRAIVELQQAGYLEREIGAGGTAQMRDWKRPNLYHLSMARNPVQVVNRGDTGVTPRGDTGVRGGGDTGVRGGVTLASPPGGDTGVTLSPFNHPIESTPLPPKGGADEFEEVFSEYPRQSAKFKAFRFWEQLTPDAALRAVMLASIRAWRSDPSWQREEGRFVPQFWKWLRDRRWMDTPGSEIAARSAPVIPPPVQASASSVPMPADVRAKVRVLLANAGKRKATEEV